MANVCICNECNSIKKVSDSGLCDECYNRLSQAGRVGTDKYGTVESTGKENRTFSTGSVRDNAEGKGRQDLIPTYPLKRLAVHFENGAKKYGDRNWEKGQPIDVYYCSAFRHLTDWMGGDDSEDHLSACIWNLFAMVDTINKISEGKLPTDLIRKLPKEIYDRITNDRLEYNRKNFKFKWVENTPPLPDTHDAKTCTDISCGCKQ